MRGATRADAAAIAALDMELFPANCFNEQTITREISAGSGLVSYDHDILAGYILVRWDWEVMDITRLGIRSSHQGKGLGPQMLLSVLSSTQLDAVLCVEKSNRRALKLYKSHDFKIIGQLPKSWVMRRSTS